MIEKQIGVLKTYIAEGAGVGSVSGEMASTALRLIESHITDHRWPRIGSAVLVLKDRDCVLLGKRNKDPHRGLWVLPGGGIKPFEYIVNAARRELREETGLEVRMRGFAGVYEIVEPPNEHRIVIYHWAEYLSGEPKASSDLSDVGFYSPGDLLTMRTTPLITKVLVDAHLLDFGS